MAYNNQIDVFVTGGTFDKNYNILDGSLNFGKTNVPSMFERGRSTLRLNIRTLMMVDSLEMTDEHTDLIIESCKNSHRNRILITHGTDRMVETAVKIAKAGITEKTIVLTGAMIPYKFGSSDGFFNLGSAVAFVQTLPVGVYIAMNGRYFRWDNVRKNYETGYFEELLNDVKPTKYPNKALLASE
ncbi:MAG: asparaginase domain-containing protein [Saprospiraceae bacterium]